MLRVSADPIDASEALRLFEQNTGGAGAIVTFSGQVRPDAEAGRVETLHLQAYSPMTESGIETAINEAKTRWSIDRVCVLHRIGDIAPGETIVFVATASKHRRTAFDAADFLMDYLKTEAVFWKKEGTTSGDQWIEPRADDYVDAARWTNKETV